MPVIKTFDYNVPAAELLITKVFKEIHLEDTLSAVGCTLRQTIG